MKIGKLFRTKKSQPKAVVYRMVTPEHICPYGLKSLYLLKKHGYQVEDHQLKTREETDAFKTEHKVSTTPLIFIDGEQVGGSDDLRRFLGYCVLAPGELTYRPVLVLFATAFLIMIASIWMAGGPESLASITFSFIAAAMMLLAQQKLRDVDAFATMFLNYDVLARRYPHYAYLYPYLEMLAGFLMLAGVLMFISIPIMLLLGGVGSYSVYKAAYLEKRKLRCACVGGDSQVPLGLVSLLENIMMLLAAIWMLLVIFL